MILLFLSTITAIPSKATMFSTNPSAFSSSFNALDEFPIFAVPAITDLIPVPVSYTHLSCPKDDWRKLIEFMTSIHNSIP